MKLLRIYFRFLSIRFFLLFLLIIMPLCCAFFCMPQFEFNSYIIENLLYYKVSSLPFWLYLVNFSSVVFLLSFVLFFSLTSFYILNQNYKKRIFRKYNNQLTSYLFEYLYDTDSSDLIRREKFLKIQKCLTSDVSKRIFINRLRRVYLQMQGELRQGVYNLFTALQCTTFIRTYLHSPYIRHKLFALRIIADLHLQGFENYIFKLTRSKNQILRAEALVTLVKLYVFNDQLFLVNIDKKLSLWDVNVIVAKALQATDKSINYNKLINSDVPEIAAVGIILARLNKQLHTKRDVQSLIESPYKLVAEQAFLTFISFANEQEDFDFLMFKFEIAPENAQIEIVRVFYYLKNKRQKIKFLMWVLDNKPLVLKIEAIKTLLKTDKTHFEILLKNHADAAVKSAFTQIENQDLIYDFY